MLDLDASFSVVDSHTAGHPTRVVLSGVPRLPGNSVRERREYFRANHDNLRPLILHEPRGHAAMVGLIPVPSEVADYGAFFISSYIYLDMCGHGTIGYAKTLAASGQITAESGIDRFTLETPAGIVTVGLNWDNAGELSGARLRNVPSHVALEGLKVTVAGAGEVTTDVVYGGMWYALVDAGELGLELSTERASAAMRLGSDIKSAVNAALGDASGAAGRPAKVDSVVFYRETGPLSAVHLVVLEPNKFDRSPCGTGTSARMAQLHRQGRLPVGETYRAFNLLGVPFEGRILDEQPGGAVTPEIFGNAHIMAFSTIVRERTDPIRNGFLPR